MATGPTNPTWTLALAIAYDGTAFEGYPLDGSKPHTEYALVRALRRVGYVEGSLRTGSRTDKGVSAAWNVVRCQVKRPTLTGLLPSLQNHAGPGLFIRAYAEVDANWNPRIAKHRTYRYVLPTPAHPDRFRQALQTFQGTHNFASFSRTEEGRSPQRTVYDIQVATQQGLTQVEVTGQSFLWNQIRRMVGTALLVQEGRMELEEVQGCLRSGETNTRIPTAPPEGLLLHHVEYPGLEWTPADLRSKPWGPLLSSMEVRVAIQHQLLDQLRNEATQR